MVRWGCSRRWHLHFSQPHLPQTRPQHNARSGSIVFDLLHQRVNDARAAKHRLSAGTSTAHVLQHLIVGGFCFSSTHLTRAAHIRARRQEFQATATFRQPNRQRKPAFLLVAKIPRLGCCPPVCSRAPLDPITSRIFGCQASCCTMTGDNQRGHQLGPAVTETKRHGHLPGLGTRC